MIKIIIEIIIISITAIIGFISGYVEFVKNEEVAKAIKPQERTGHWIEKMDACECPYCHKAWDYCDNDTEDFDYCPKCGANMSENPTSSEPQKSEDNMAEFPTYEQMAKNVAEKALDEFLYNGKSIREWMQIIASEDAISRQAVLSYIYNDLGLGDEENGADIERQVELERSYKYIKSLSSVNPQEPKKCKDCKWWRDSDGYYRRGVFTESKCPINRIEVFEGNGYCYMFETKESEVQDADSN